MHSIRHIAQSMIEAKLFLQLSFIAVTQQLKTPGSTGGKRKLK
mgnify:CR=1 FL=1